MDTVHPIAWPVEGQQAMAVFGRTPRISYANSTQMGVKLPGRDHWPEAMSVLVAGGGMRTGQIV